MIETGSDASQQHEEMMNMDDGAHQYELHTYGTYFIYLSVVAQRIDYFSVCTPTNNSYTLL